MYTRYTYIHTHTCIIDWYSMLNNCRHKQSLLALTMNELTDHAQKAGTPCREATYRHRNSFIHRKRQCRYQDIYLYWIEIERKRVRERHSEMPIQNSPSFNIIYWNSNPNSNLFLHFLPLFLVRLHLKIDNTTQHRTAAAVHRFIRERHMNSTIDLGIIEPIELNMIWFCWLRFRPHRVIPGLASGKSPISSVNHRMNLYHFLIYVYIFFFSISYFSLFLLLYLFFYFLSNSIVMLSSLLSINAQMGRKKKYGVETIWTEIIHLIYVRLEK